MPINKEHLKIVHVAESFGGGVFNYIVDLSNSLVSAGDEVYVVHSIRPETPENFESFFDSRVEFLKIEMVRHPSLSVDLKAVQRLKQIFRNLKPDVIHLHSSKAGAVGRVAAKLAGTSASVFYSPHGLSFLRTDVGRVNKKFFEVFEWIGARFGGHILSCSESEYMHVKNIINPRKHSLLENAVNVSDIPLKSWVKEGKVKIGTVGRLSFQKNPKLFLKMMEVFKGGDIEFLWVGDFCPGVTSTSRIDVNVDEIPLTGWLPRVAALNKMRELDIYIQTSLWEGMPLSLIEAQVAGLPAIVTNSAGNVDVIVQNETGFIANDEEEFVCYLRKLLTDKGLREKMGKEARRVALERFDGKKFIQKIDSIYHGSDNLMNWR